MILTDTGPLVALIDRKDPNHAVCMDAMGRLPADPLVTTWPCFTEAMHLLHREGGFAAQVSLWKLVRGDRLVLHVSSPDEADRMEKLMDRYRDLPMDLADASIVTAAEQLNVRRLFSLDSDFHVYRLADGSTLEIIP